MQEPESSRPPNLFLKDIDTLFRRWNANNLRQLDHILHSIALNAGEADVRPKAQEMLNAKLKILLIHCITSSIDVHDGTSIQEKTAYGELMFQRFCNVLGVELHAVVTGGKERYESVDGGSMPIFQVLSAARSIIAAVIAESVAVPEPSWWEIWKRKLKK